MFSNMLISLPAQLICTLVSSFNPILTLRFAISLRKSADPNGGQQWEVTHFNTPHFARAVSPDTQVSTIHENIEMDPVYHPLRPTQVWEHE